MNPQHHIPPIDGDDLINALAQHIRSLFHPHSRHTLHNPPSNTTRDPSFVGSLMSMFARTPTSTAKDSTKQPQLLIPPPLPISAGRFKPHPKSALASDSRQTTNLPSPLASFRIPGDSRFSIDHTHLAFLAWRFHTSPSIQKYLDHSSTPHSTSSFLGLGSRWFRPSATDPEALLLFIFQSLDQLRCLRVTQSSKRGIAGWPPMDFLADMQMLTFLHNLSCLEFKGVSPSCVNLSGLHLHINTLIVQSHLESLDKALGYNSWPNLSVLDLSNNCLESLDPKILARAENLTELSLHNNNLSEFPDILPLIHLTSMDLSYNAISHLPDPFLCHKSLQKLNLHANHLQAMTSIPSMFPQLTQLIVSKNQLASLPPLHTLEFLADLQLWGNPLVGMDESAYRSMLESCLGQVKHMVVDGVRLVPLAGASKKNKVKSRYIQLDVSCEQTLTNRPLERNLPGSVVSPCACLTDHECLDATSFPPLTISQQTETLPTPSNTPINIMGTGSGNCPLPILQANHKDLVQPYIHRSYNAMESNMAEQRMRTRVEELKKLSGPTNWMRHLIHETATYQKSSSPGSSPERNLDTSPTICSLPHNQTAQHQMRTLSDYDTPITHVRTASLASLRAPPNTDPLVSKQAPPSATECPSLEHSDSAIATLSSPGNLFGRCTPQPSNAHKYNVEIANHTKPVSLPEKLADLVFRAAHVSHTLEELSLNEAIAGHVLQLQMGQVYMQVAMRKSGNTPIRYVTVAFSGKEAGDLASKWAHALDLQLTNNWNSGHLDAVCSKAECVVCPQSGFVRDSIGHPLAVSHNHKSVLQLHELDPRQGQYIDVQIRHSGKKLHRKQQIECSVCGTLVSLYLGHL